MEEGKIKSTGNRNLKNRRTGIAVKRKKTGNKQNTAEKSPSFRCPYDKFLWINLFSVGIQHISISLWSFPPLKLNFRKSKLVYNDWYAIVIATTFIYYYVLLCTRYCEKIYIHSYLIRTIILRYILLKFREVKQLAQDPLANKWGSQDINHSVLKQKRPDKCKSLKERCAKTNCIT